MKLFFKILIVTIIGSMVTFATLSLVSFGLYKYAENMGDSNLAVFNVTEKYFDPLYAKKLEGQEKEIFKTYNLIGKQYRKDIKNGMKIKLQLEDYPNDYGIVELKNADKFTVFYEGQEYKGTITDEGIEVENNPEPTEEDELTVPERYGYYSYAILMFFGKDEFDILNFIFKYASYGDFITLKERSLVDNQDGTLTITTGTEGEEVTGTDDDEINAYFTFTVDKETYSMISGQISMKEQGEEEMTTLGFEVVK